MKKQIRQLFHYYLNDVKLQKKFLISHLILVLLPTLVIAVLLYSQLSNIMLSNTIKSEQNLSKQTVNNIENIIDVVQSASSAVTENDFFKKSLYYSAHDLQHNLYYNEDFKAEAVAFLNKTSSFVDFSTISTIKIYVDERLEPLVENLNTKPYNIYKDMNAVKGSYWYGIFASTDKQSLVCPTLYLTPTEKRDYGELAIIRKINYIINGEETSAYVAVYFNKDTVDSVLRENMSIADSSSILLNERDSIISSSNSYISGKYLVYYKDVMAKCPNANNYKVVSFGREHVYMAYNEIANTDWIMVSLIPTTGVLEESSFVVWQFILFYLFFLFVAFVISFALSRSIVRRISSVIAQMKTVKTGTPMRLDQSISHDEIGDLVDTYNYMTDEMNHLLTEQAESANALRVSEFKALQAQINPHFLYNTLDMINWLSKSGKSDEVSAAVQALSKFYKFTLNKGNITVSVGEELEHVSLYVQLQNMRYKNKIHFLIDVPDELLDYEMPRLIFQPIVENSIQHGIFEKESKEGDIFITGWLEEQTIVFIVSDNGVGIPPEKIPTILSGRDESTTGSNVGIYNTHKRLQLFSDASYGLTYRSTQHVLTEVEIRIPARKMPQS